MAVPLRRATIPGTYFVTSRTWQSRKLFAKPSACEIFLETLFRYRDRQDYHVHAFVLMPDHFHLLLTPGPNATLERAVQFIKGASARSIRTKLNFRFPVWQRGFSDHRIRDRQDCGTHIHYTEENPVKEGLASSASEYAWGSASGRFRMDDFPQGLKPLS